MIPERFELDDGRVTVALVPIPQLRAVWPELQRGLHVVRETNGEPWIPEDVYGELVTGRATLYTFRVDEELIGFCVLQPMTFPFTYEAALNIWVGWAKDKGNGWLGIAAAKHVAEKAGMRRIVFSTPQRNAWLDERFKPLSTWYEVK